MFRAPSLIFTTSYRFLDYLLTTSPTTIEWILNDLTAHNGHPLDGEAVVDAVALAMRVGLCHYRRGDIHCIWTAFSACDSWLHLFARGCSSIARLRNLAGDLCFADRCLLP